MAQIIRCGNCGKEIGNSRRCPYCGVEPGGPSPDDIFDAQAAMRVNKAEAQGRGAKALMILAGTMTVMMAAGIVIYFARSSALQSSPQPITPVLIEGNTAAPSDAASDSVAGSTAIAPDPVNPDALNQPLVDGNTSAASPASGDTAPAAPVADGELTEDQAIDRVAAFPEVKNWMNLVHAKAPNNKTMIRSEGLQMGRYLIHVYEDVGDGNGSGHAATFGWYEVDKKTGEVVKSEE